MTTTMTTDQKKPVAKKAPAKAPATKAPAKQQASTEPAVPTQLVSELRAYADKYRAWGGGGWDVIADQWTDQQIADAIQGAKSLMGAQRKIGPHVLAIRAERDAAKAKAETFKAKEEQDAEVNQ